MGDIAERSVLDRVIDDRTAAIFHLAAIVSGQAEADFDLGMRINLDASRLLLETCRQRGHTPRVVFTSSVAVYGGDLPEVVQNDTALNPQSSYGAQKAIAELLLNDYTRRGFVDGRVLRLPTISVRPGKPNAAASSFASGIIREPLNGEAAVCPVAGTTRLWLLSPRKAIESLIAGLELDSAALGNQRVLNLPGISVSVDEMVAALREVAGDEAREADRVGAGCAGGEDCRQLAGAVGYLACRTARVDRRAQLRRCDPQLYRRRADSDPLIARVPGQSFQGHYGWQNGPKPCARQA